MFDQNQWTEANTNSVHWVCEMLLKDRGYQTIALPGCDWGWLFVSDGLWDLHK